jgi:hypothetical protein
VVTPSTHSPDEGLPHLPPTSDEVVADDEGKAFLAQLMELVEFHDLRMRMALHPEDVLSEVVDRSQLLHDEGLALLEMCKNESRPPEVRAHYLALADERYQRVERLLATGREAIPRIRAHADARLEFLQRRAQVAYRRVTGRRTYATRPPLRRVRVRQADRRSPRTARASLSRSAGDDPEPEAPLHVGLARALLGVLRHPLPPDWDRIARAARDSWEVA